MLKSFIVGLLTFSNLTSAQQRFRLEPRSMSREAGGSTNSRHQLADTYPNFYQLHQNRALMQQQTTLRPNPPTAWLTPASEPSNAARPVMCSVRDSHGAKCDLNVGPDDCGAMNWTSAVTFTTLGSEVLGTFVDLPDQPIGTAMDPRQRQASASVAYRMPASKSTGGISVAVVRISASCCVRRLTVVGYTSAGSADHCNLNLCGHNTGQCQHGGLCTATPGQCVCKAGWTGKRCEDAQPLTTSTTPIPNQSSGGYIYWPGASSVDSYREVPSSDFTAIGGEVAATSAENKIANAFGLLGLGNALMDVQGTSTTVEPFYNQPASFQQQAEAERNANRRWCPDKFLCCDHGLAYYDPNHEMMCCNNRAVPIANFSKSCPEIANSRPSKPNFSQSGLPPAPSAALTAAAAQPVVTYPGLNLNRSFNNSKVPAGVVLLAKGGAAFGGQNGTNTLLQRIAAAVASGQTSETDAEQLLGAALATQTQTDMMEMVCNGITHWVARNNRARFGCCGGKIYDIVWDSCAITSAGMGVVRRIAANGKNSTLNKGEGEKIAHPGFHNGHHGSHDQVVTMVPPPTPMGNALKNENEVQPLAHTWLHHNVFKKQQQQQQQQGFVGGAGLVPQMAPSMQRRRRIVSRSRHRPAGGARDNRKAHRRH